MDNDSQGVADAELVTESLVEEVSIDGMCGVY
ncbi:MULTISPECIES: mycofactocin precursor MftA [Mycolicibacterium]|jgi:mycofactocin precursor peptide MftA|uniref:Mycofactocin n=1 Tax=Mycolicibacterium tokaiense TaxID=39695 RepID=A0A378TC89_9MYCO|nr:MULTISPECIES: mycofactocin precursor MftA [Mycolicibacterium]MCV7185808.1 mycofactocin precursor [Mycolicibacterium murale]STZ58074.1 mycofactocin precursor [Mycolicibacterium tokaiense]